MLKELAGSVFAPEPIPEGLFKDLNAPLALSPRKAFHIIILHQKLHHSGPAACASLATSLLLFLI